MHMLNAGHLFNFLKGWAEWTLRNADGSVAATGREDNVVTNMERRFIATLRGPASFMWILDDERPAGLKRGLTTFYRDAQTPAAVVTSPTVTYNATTFTISRAAVWTAPSSPPRTIRKIALGRAGDPGASTRTARAVMTYLALSPAIVQNTGQTLEIVYRQQFQIPGKTLRRWEAVTLPNLRRWAHLMSGGVSGQSIGGTLWGGFAPIYYGANYFTDQELRQCARSFNGFYGTDNWNMQWNAIGPSEDTQASALTASRRAGLTFNLAAANNSSRVGAFGAVQVTHQGTWGGSGETDNGSTVASGMELSLGAQPLARAEGDVSTVFKHPVGESYFFNVVGSVPASQGNVEVQGPYRPENPSYPVSQAFEVYVTDAGGLGSGTEGKYILRRGQFEHNTSLTGNAQTSRVFLQQHYSGRGNDTVAPGGVHFKPSVVEDGNGLVWATGNTTISGKSSLHFWQLGSVDQISPDQLEQDTTRWFGLEQSAPFEYVSRSSNIQRTPCALATDKQGRTFFGKRGVAGAQAVFVIDNTKPGRHYQRPSGFAVGGNQTFQVDAADEVHAMHPFAGPADVGRQVRLEASPGVFTTRTITAVNGPYSVELDGAALPALTECTWHWICVTKRGVATGLVDQPRVLLYDRTNARLWAFLDTGIQVSTDMGATWSALITESNGLTVAAAKVCRGFGGAYYGQQTACVGNDGAIYWVDTAGGVNKYVGAGPGGTHSRITGFGGSAPAYSYDSPWNGAGIWGLAYDPVAPHMATTQGALWLLQGHDNQSRSFYRINLDVAFTLGNVTTYTNPTVVGGVANQHQQGANGWVHTLGGRMCFASTNNQQWSYWDPQDNTFRYFHVFLTTHASDEYQGAWGGVHVMDDGTVIQFARPDTDHRVWQPWCQWFWDDVALVWRPWFGTGAQFNARYGVTNDGKKLAHGTWELLKDNVRCRFVENGLVAQVEEFVADERFTFIGAYGVHRTNIQDISWEIHQSWADAEHYLEEEDVRTVEGRGPLTAFWRMDNSLSPAAAATAELGPAGIPALDSSGVNYGWAPRQFRGIYNNPSFGPVPNTYFNANSRGVNVGLDLGAAYEAHKIRAQFYIEQEELMYLRAGSGNERGRFLVYHSDDNVSWTQATEVSAEYGWQTGPVEPNTASKFLLVEHNAGGDSPTDTVRKWIHLTFDLVGSGMSAPARTHRYWKLVLTNALGIVSADAFSALRFIFGGMSVFDSADNAIAVPASLRLPATTDVNTLYQGVLEASFIQDYVGNGGKGGINSSPHAINDGFTDTVAIASGTFDTGAINPATDVLAYRHPTTGKFLRPAPGGPGHPGALGEQTAVRIVSATSGTIVVAKRNVPDNLAGVDWEVRRPMGLTQYFPNAGQLGYCPVAGYMQFHPTDNGKLYTITRRVVVRRA